MWHKQYGGTAYKSSWKSILFIPSSSQDDMGQNTNKNLYAKFICLKLISKATPCKEISQQISPTPE